MWEKECVLMLFYRLRILFRGFILQNRFPFPLLFHLVFDLNAWKIVFIYAALGFHFSFVCSRSLHINGMVSPLKCLVLRYFAIKIDTDIDCVTMVNNISFLVRYCQRTVKWNRQNRYYFDCTHREKERERVRDVVDRPTERTRVWRSENSFKGIVSRRAA